MNKIAMIVAGGKGSRMKASLPKQFLILDDRPVLMHTLEVFRKYDPLIRIILVLPEGQFQTWITLCREYEFSLDHELGMGGDTRFHSVKNNLQRVPDNCLLAIHDGVRPLVSTDTISRCFNEAQKSGNAVPCVNIPETLRRIDNGTNEQVNRDHFRLIQTPQVFLSNILKEAYKQDYRKDFTDDAGVLEYAGYSVNLVEGNPENIKITYLNDLKIANALISH